MATADDWPDTYPAGSPDWFDAMKKRLEKEANNPPASKLAEHARTTEEANLLIELVQRASKRSDTDGQAEPDATS